MSLFIEIELPGLTREVAIDLDRRADLAGAPFSFVTPRAPTRWRAARRAYVGMEDLREDPSIGSETLDHPEGWPKDNHVRAWLEQAIRFLGTNAPEQRFTFHAGWPEHRATSTQTLDLADFLELIVSGRIRSAQRYDVGLGK